MKVEIEREKLNLWDRDNLIENKLKKNEAQFPNKLISKYKIKKNIELLESEIDKKIYSIK